MHPPCKWHSTHRTSSFRTKLFQYRITNFGVSNVSALISSKNNVFFFFLTTFPFTNFFQCNGLNRRIIFGCDTATVSHSAFFLPPLLFPNSNNSNLVSAVYTFLTRLPSSSFSYFYACKSHTQKRCATNHHLINDYSLNMQVNHLENTM